jgi:hypothetical protein
MLTTRHIFLILAVIVFVIVAKKLYYNTTEHYVNNATALKSADASTTNTVTDVTVMRELINKGKIDMIFQTLNVELLEAKEITGRLFLDYYVGSIHIHLGDVELVLSPKNTKILHKGKKIHELDFGITTKVLYNFRILLYPIEDFIAIIVNDKLIFGDFITSMGKSQLNVKFIVKDVANGQRTFFQSKPAEYSFLTPDVQLCKLHVGNRYLDYSSGLPTLVNGDIVPNTIWNVERQSRYYSLKSLKDNSYLGFNKTMYLTNTVDDSSKLVILCKGDNCIIFNKKNYVLNIESGKLDNVFYSVLKLDKVTNIEQWINYGSTFSLVNNTKEYLSGNPNLKYDFKGSSGLSSVYVDTIADNQLINWTLEDLDGKLSGHLVKDGNSIYLKNNGQYLQVIRGNPTPNGTSGGMEVSLGGEKNKNSMWVLKGIGALKGLFKKDDSIYLYHPQTHTFLYNTGKKFTLAGHSKQEVIGLDTKDKNIVWTIVSPKILETTKESYSDINYYKFKEDKEYLTKKEKEWKQLLELEDKKVKEQLHKYNTLKGVTDDLDKEIRVVHDELDTLGKTKCPNRKVCEKLVYGDCVQDKLSKPYEVVYKKDNSGIIKSTKWINTSDIGRCTTTESNSGGKNKGVVAKDDISVA